MKTKFSTTLLALLICAGVNGQSESKEESGKTDKITYLKIECLNEKNEQSYINWTNGGKNIDCEKESGHLNFEMNGWTMPIRFNEVYKGLVQEIKKEHNISDFLVRSIEMQVSKTEIFYVVRYAIVNKEKEGVYKMTLENNQ